MTTSRCDARVQVVGGEAINRLWFVSQTGMGQETLGGADISELRAAYDRKIHEQLPERAQNGDAWPITEDHCFGRVVLDNLFEDEWYSYVEGRPAYEHLSPAELQQAIDIADRMLDGGRPVVAALNERSLRWRDDTE